MSVRHILAIGDPAAQGVDVITLASRFGLVASAVRGRRNLPSVVASVKPAAVFIQAETVAEAVAICADVRQASHATVLVLCPVQDRATCDRLISAGADHVTDSPLQAESVFGWVLGQGFDDTPGSPVRHYGRLSIDPGARRATLDDEELDLTRIEYDILDLLSQRSGVVVSRSEIRHSVWPGDWYGHDHVIDVQIARLRGKLGETSRAPTFIHTVRGIGYRWDCAEATRTADSVTTIAAQDDALPRECELIVRHSADVLVRYASDGTVLWVSPSVRTELGWRPEQLRGRKFPLLTPASTDVAREMFATAIAAHTDAFDARLQAVSADGGWHWVDVRYGLAWHGDRLDSIVGVLRQVDATVHLERQLRDTRQLYQSAAERVADAVIRADNAGVLEWVSPAAQELIGWSMQELRGRPFLSLVHPDDVGRVRAVQANILRGRRDSVEVRLRTPSGHYRRICSRVVPVRNDEGDVIGRIAMWRDATLALTADAGLRHAN